MNKQRFIDFLNEECINSDNVDYSISSSKGTILLMWSITFSMKTYDQAFEDHQSEIGLANLMIKKLKEKYSNQLLRFKILTKQDAEHFEHIFNTTKSIPVKKAYETDTQSMCGFIEFSKPDY